MYTYIHQSSCTSYPTDVILQYLNHPPPTSYPPIYYSEKFSIYVFSKIPPLSYTGNSPHTYSEKNPLYVFSKTSPTVFSILYENALRCSGIMHLTGNLPEYRLEMP